MSLDAGPPAEPTLAATGRGLPAAADPGLPAGVTIGAALGADLPAIRRAVRAAFGHDLEARLVERLEREGRVQVSVVARAGDEVVGHAMLSRVALVPAGPARPDAAGPDAAGLDVARPALALAPVAVVPERQRRGIGSALVRTCLALAGPRLPVFVIGAPGFYGRFGFVPAEPCGIASRFEVPLGHFMVRPGATHAGGGGAGDPAPPPRLLDYPPAFG